MKRQKSKVKKIHQINFITSSKSKKAYLVDIPLYKFKPTSKLKYCIPLEELAETKFGEHFTKFKNQIRKYHSGIFKEYCAYLPENYQILGPNKTYTLIIDYPLRVPFKQDIRTTSKGKSLKELVILIVNAYKQIYAEEKKTTKLKIETMGERYGGALLNRAETDGKYKIWGHDLNDLALVEIVIQGNKILLGVDS